MNPLNTQHGGSHYKTMKIQPVEFGYANGYDNCAFSTLKYISRHRDKAGALDLDKALHFVELRETMMAKYGACVAMNEIPVLKYIKENEIPPAEAVLLTVLHGWATEKTNDADEAVKVLKGGIRDLRNHVYK